MGILGNGTPKSSSPDVLTKEQLTTTAELAAAMLRAVDYSLAELSRHARPLFVPAPAETLARMAAEQAGAALAAVTRPVPASAEAQVAETATIDETPEASQATTDLDIDEIRTRIAGMASPQGGSHA